MDPLMWLLRLAALIGEILAQKSSESPELVEPGDAKAPKPAPTDDDLDPEVAAEIERGEL